MFNLPEEKLSAKKEQPTGSAKEKSETASSFERIERHWIGIEEHSEKENNRARYVESTRNIVYNLKIITYGMTFVYKPINNSEYIEAIQLNLLVLMLPKATA